MKIVPLKTLFSILFSKLPTLRLLIVALMFITAFAFVESATYAAETFPIKKAKKSKKTPATTVDDRGLAVIEKTRDSRKRVALVIGNSSYKSSPLKNPANDARTMARTLRKLGFDVDEKTDLNYFQFNEAVENFGNRLKTGGVGLSTMPVMACKFMATTTLSPSIPR